MIDPKRILNKLEIEYVTDCADIGKPAERMLIYPMHIVSATDADGQVYTIEICLTLEQQYVVRYRGPSLNTGANRFSGSDWDSFCDVILDDIDRKALKDWTPYVAMTALYTAFEETKKILKLVERIYESTGKYKL